MKEYYVADSYKGFERIGNPYDKNGKLYTSLCCKCDRCTNGVYVSRVENGHIVPHPYAGGVCFACNGSGYITKEARLYTEAEYNTMQKNKERAAAKREADREAKMKAEFAHNKEIWLQTNGFSPEGYTYIVIGDSYSIKDELKEAGFHYNGGLRRWMRGSAEGYEDKVIEFKLEDLYEISAWGDGHLLNNAKTIVDNREKELFPVEPSEWIGEVGKRVPAITVTLVNKRGYENQYGYGYVYNFKTAEGSILTWFTKVDIHKDIDDIFTIACGIKKHDTYKDQKVTIVTRVKVKD